MKHPLKSLLALLLALCMSLSLLTAGVWAVDASDPASEDLSVQEELAPEEEVPAAEEESAAEDIDPVDENLADPADEEEIPADEEEVPADNEEVSADDELDEDALDVQSKPTYHPNALSVRLDDSKISATITHGTRPTPAKAGMRIIIDGAEAGTNSWKECENMDLGNNWTYGLSTLPCSSDDGSWGSLTLTSGHSYVFRACYTNEYSERSDYAYSDSIDYYSKTQDKATLQQRIQNYLTVGLSADEGKNMVYKSAYDEKGLTANKTELLYNRPLYQLDVKYTGTSVGTGLDQGDTMLNFSATYASRVRSNGFQQGDARYVEGLDFRLEGLWFVNKNGTEQYQSLSESAGKQNFTVNLNEMGSGCNYIKLRLICYGYNTYGVKQYWVEEPIYFNVGFSATPLNTYSALTTKNAITLKPCTNYGGTLSYDSALPAAKGNVRAVGMKVWYRKKGTSKWTPKTFSGTKPPVIKGLKPNTVYQWKAQYYITSKSHTGAIQTITAPETKVFNVCTAVTAKPKVKSCKVSKVKVVKHRIAAHWQKTGTNRWSWIKEQVWYTTDFKVTYTFANASKNIKGYTSGGVYAPVKKGKVTFSMSVNTGKKKAKAKKFTAKLKSCTNTNGPGVDVSGLSPVLKYTGKIK